MKISRSSKVLFTEGLTGAAIAVHVKIKALANRVSRVNRDGVFNIHLTVRSNLEIAEGLTGYISGILSVDAGRIEVVGKPESADRLIAVTGMSAAELQKRIIAAAT